MDAIRNAGRTITGQPKSQAEELEDSLCEFCPALTYTQRLYGFISCWVLGYVLTFGSTLSLLNSSPQGLRNFATLYVIGSVIAICATGFLIGPRRQCQKMFHPSRRIACLVYLFLLIAVFAAAIAEAPLGVILLMMVAQVMAATWYAASYIPYGRSMIKSFFKELPCIRSCKR